MKKRIFIPVLLLLLALLAGCNRKQQETIAPTEFHETIAITEAVTEEATEAVTEEVTEEIEETITEVTDSGLEDSVFDDMTEETTPATEKVPSDVETNSPNNPTTDATKPTTGAQENAGGTSGENAGNTTEAPTEKPTTAPDEDKEEIADPQSMTYEKFQSLSPSEQQAFMNSFESIDAFFVWYNAAKEKYEAENPDIEVNGGSIDLGGIVGGSN